MLRIASLVGLLLMVLALVGLLLSDSLLSRSPVVIAVQCAALALMVWARLTFGVRSMHAAANPTAGGLVTTGPYHFIRHPIYTAACLVGWAGMAAHWSPTSAMYGVLLFAGALIRMLCEERLVAEAFPAYRDYARVTKRMLPYVF
jgi:protein-S-isoprenylcysteine O-methyltransferase Ste14